MDESTCIADSTITTKVYFTYTVRYAKFTQPTVSDQDEPRSTHDSNGNYNDHFHNQDIFYLRFPESHLCAKQLAISASKKVRLEEGEKMNRRKLIERRVTHRVLLGGNGWRPEYEKREYNLKVQ